MTLRHMKILVEVYRQNSVTKAAQALHLSQPSVSLALRELEDYYGVTLFERVGRRISHGVRPGILRLRRPCGVADG